MTNAIKGVNWVPQKPRQQDQPEHPLQTAYRKLRADYRDALEADRARATNRRVG